jgi:hypothetical protein
VLALALVAELVLALHPEPEPELASMVDSDLQMCP